MARALLLAWYALMPPLIGGVVVPQAPLGRWEQIRAFDTAEQCEKQMMAYVQQIAAATDNATLAQYGRVRYVRCIYAADPRLQGAK